MLFSTVDATVSASCSSQPQTGLLRKSLCLAAPFGVTKFTNFRVMFWVTAWTLLGAHSQKFIKDVLTKVLKIVKYKFYI